MPPHNSVAFRQSTSVLPHGSHPSSLKYSLAGQERLDQAQQIDGREAHLARPRFRLRLSHESSG